LAIDSGSSVLAPATDIVGTVRPQGKGIDIGAYEYLIPTAALRPVGGTADAKTLRLIAGYDRLDRSIFAYIKTSPSMRLLNETKGYFFSVYDIHGRQCATTSNSSEFSIRFKGTDYANGFSPGVYVVSAKNSSAGISSLVIVR